MKYIFPIHAGIKVPAGNHKKILRIDVLKPLLSGTERNIFLGDPAKQIIHPYIIIFFIRRLMQDCYRFSRFQHGILHVIVIHIFRFIKQTGRQRQIPYQCMTNRHTIPYRYRFTFRGKRSQIQITLYGVLFCFRQFAALTIYSSPHGPRVRYPGKELLHRERIRNAFHFRNVQGRVADFPVELFYSFFIQDHRIARIII